MDEIGREMEELLKELRAYVREDHLDDLESYTGEGELEPALNVFWWSLAFRVGR